MASLHGHCHGTAQAYWHAGGSIFVFRQASSLNTNSPGNRLVNEQSFSQHREPEWAGIKPSGILWCSDAACAAHLQSVERERKHPCRGWVRLEVCAEKKQSSHCLRSHDHQLLHGPLQAGGRCAAFSGGMRHLATLHSYRATCFWNRWSLVIGTGAVGNIILLFLEGNHCKCVTNSNWEGASVSGWLQQTSPLAVVSWGLHIPSKEADVCICF